MKTFSIAAIAITSILLAGCGKASRMDANLTGHAEVCVDGVKYLQFPSGATVKVDRAGKPVPC